MEINKANTYLRQFNETIEKWITYLDDYTLEMLCQKPQINSWSLGQVYVHIVEDTEYFIEQMKASLLFDNANSEKEMHRNAKVMFENNEFPDMLLDNPSNNPNLRMPQSKDELLQSLVLIKDEVNKLYSISDFSNSNGKTEHPGLLFFNALEWLRFAEMHMRHHLRQKSRIDDKIFSK
ncbi:DinB superfamily protein [Chitinophaga sp. CF118]|uniref:DinB family protein n=1 Tax=Chitinophaga sp. CF118 TaxID=1884367 RepID=UPI0008F0E47D|nr:DinB family protein [Chitinophaga sp. CF118]SFD58187.1 DinB superfamily protein [Chitinophaga sp. CF118]